jgi:antitoxin MazE
MLLRYNLKEGEVLNPIHGKHPEAEVEKVVTRKVARMGNSLGIGLPKVIVDHLQVQQGDEIDMVLGADGKITLHRREVQALPTNIRGEVLEAFYDVFKSDKGIFDDLRDR